MDGATQLIKIALFLLESSYHVSTVGTICNGPKQTYFGFTSESTDGGNSVCWEIEKLMWWKVMWGLESNSVEKKNQDEENEWEWGKNNMRQAVLFWCGAESV